MAAIGLAGASRISLIAPPGAFRLFLAFLVMASHITRFDVGRLAVLLFFYLSGYWVTKVWVEKFGQRNTLKFYAARYLRIAPLYLLVMAVSAVVLASRTGLENFTLLGVASTSRDPLGVSWSLDVELQFYLLLPLLVPLLTAGAEWLVIASLVVAVFAWIVSARLGITSAFQYLPAFLLGGLTYTRAWRPQEATANLSLAAFGFMTVAVYFTPFMDKRIPDPFDRDIFSFIWMLPLLPYVARSLSTKSGPLDRHLGNLSFPLYLVHYPMIDGFTDVFGRTSLVRVGAAGFACVVSLALYVAIDRNIDRWRVSVTETGLKGSAKRA